MAVRFFGPLSNHTGYGNAVANFAKAFSMSTIDTKFNIKSNAKGEVAEFAKGLRNYTGHTDIDFYLHCPPYTKHRSNAYKIAYFYWEADTLPRGWSRGLNQVNELWVPCQLVRTACLKAKFRGKIRIIPTPCNDWDTEEKISLLSPFSDEFIISDDVYKFYSIFQWQNRKGWKTLLNSYYNAFKEDDNVILILKVNSLKMAGYSREMIKPDILNLKRKLNLEYYPPIYLSSDIVPSNYIKALHNTADCYVTSHHGEGWGMPIHDAMRMGNQIITTKYGGITEYLDENSAHIIKHSVGPVRDMAWSKLYGTYQNWAYPSSNHLTRIFRDVYLNHSSYEDKALRAKAIADSMSIPSVARIISKELSEGRR